MMKGDQRCGPGYKHETWTHRNVTDNLMLIERLEWDEVTLKCDFLIPGREDQGSRNKRQGVL